MQKLINCSFVSLFLLLSLFSCKKNNEPDPPFVCQTCHTSPDAIAANDVSSKGVYKAVVIGSTGTIQFNILNGNNTITAIMVIDGVTINLTSAVTWANGVSFVAPFTGTLNGAVVTINFNVGSDGSNPLILSATIPGHPNSSFVILKELSTSLIECFEGTYSSSEPKTGTFNLLLSRTLNKYYAISHQTGGSSSGDSKGTIVNNKLVDEDGTAIGALSGDEINGTFKDGGNNTVKIRGLRTN